MAYKGLMWDLDGTLVEFQIDYQLIREKVMFLLQRAGYPYKLMEHERYALRMLDAGTKYLKSQKIMSDHKIANLRETIDASIEEIEEKAAFKAVPIPGMLKVFYSIPRDSLKMGVVTLNTSKNTLISLVQAGFNPFFPNPNYIIGRDISPNQKPHPDHPQILLQRMELQPSDVILIGDHPTDIEAANALKITSIAITSHNYSPDAFQTPYFVSKQNIFPDLFYLLESLRK